MRALGTELRSSCQKSQELWLINSSFLALSKTDIHLHGARVLSRCRLTVSCYRFYAREVRCQAEGGKASITQEPCTTCLQGFSQSGQPRPTPVGWRVRVKLKLQFVQVSLCCSLAQSNLSHTAGASCDGGPPWRAIAFQGSSLQSQLHGRNSWGLWIQPACRHWVNQFWGTACM